MSEDVSLGLALGDVRAGEFVDIAAGDGTITTATVPEHEHRLEEVSVDSVNTLADTIWKLESTIDTLKAKIKALEIKSQNIPERKRENSGPGVSRKKLTLGT